MKIFVIFDSFVAFVFMSYTGAFQGSGDFTDLMGRPVRLLDIARRARPAGARRAKASA